jgi:hypothetical protein
MKGEGEGRKSNASGPEKYSAVWPVTNYKNRLRKISRRELAPISADPAGVGGYRLLAFPKQAHPDAPRNLFCEGYQGNWAAPR